MGKGKRTRDQRSLEEVNFKKKSEFGLGQRGMNRKMRRERVMSSNKMNHNFIKIAKGCFGRSF